MAHARHLKATSSGVAMRSRNNSWIQEVLTCGGKVEGTWLPNYFKGNERERDIKKKFLGLGVTWRMVLPLLLE